MMRMILIALALSALPVSAETPMSGAEFEAYTTGKTLTYFESGYAYGTERYKKDRKVTWAFDGDDCQDGEWYEPEPGLICFLYEDGIDGPQCWNFFRGTTGLRAKFASDPDGRELYETRPNTKSLQCLGPDVGV
jgi:hypothetical protein